MGGGEVEENLLIGVKKRSIINNKKIISNIIIREGKLGRIGRKVLSGPSPQKAFRRFGCLERRRRRVGRATERPLGPSGRPPEGGSECPPTADSHGGPGKQRNKQRNKQGE